MGNQIILDNQKNLENLENQIMLDNLDCETLRNDTRYADWCIGQVVRASIEVRQDEIAAKLFGCKMRWMYVKKTFTGKKAIGVLMSGPVSTIEDLERRYQYRYGREKQVNKSRKLLEHYTRLVLPPNLFVREWAFNVDLSPLASNWREELLEIVNKKTTKNQIVNKKSPIQTMAQSANLIFRSASDVSIAEAFDNAGVLYFANYTARIRNGEKRSKCEPDFLVCHNGKWGILDVDDEAFQVVSQPDVNQDRESLFRSHGVRFVQSYNAKRCSEEPARVISEFLEMLLQSG